MKKTYEAPAIMHTEKLGTRVSVCAKADSNCAGSGNDPIQS
jgi:hypothetical protein